MKMILSSKGILCSSLNSSIIYHSLLISGFNFPEKAKSKIRSPSTEITVLQSNTSPLSWSEFSDEGHPSSPDVDVFLSVSIHPSIHFIHYTSIYKSMHPLMQTYIHHYVSISNIYLSIIAGHQSNRQSSP